MKHTLRRIVLLWIALLPALALALARPAMAQENPPPKPVELPCATNVSIQLLGSTPVNDGVHTLVLTRMIFPPGGQIAAHTHPSTRVVTVESGLLGFTNLGEAEMIVNRASTAEGEATVEPLPLGKEVAINPGDWFVETGMIHSAANLADGPTTTLITDLVETGKPLTICGDVAPTTPPETPSNQLAR